MMTAVSLPDANSDNGKLEAGLWFSFALFSLLIQQDIHWPLLSARLLLLLRVNIWKAWLLSSRTVSGRQPVTAKSRAHSFLMATKAGSAQNSRQSVPSRGLWPDLEE